MAEKVEVTLEVEVLLIKRLLLLLLLFFFFWGERKYEHLLTLWYSVIKKRQGKLLVFRLMATLTIYYSAVLEVMKCVSSVYNGPFTGWRQTIVISSFDH